MQELDKVRVVQCPTCGGKSVYSDANTNRPFCSERCKGRDFGAWADESFRVAAPELADDSDLGGNSLQ